tara:strand:+ start:114 stop:1742 length:1629 start_codon:yes stop_codon:yes gene_type:complete
MSVGYDDILWHDGGTTRFGQFGSPLSRLKNYFDEKGYGELDYTFGSSGHGSKDTAEAYKSRQPWFTKGPTTGITQAWIPDTIPQADAMMMGWGDFGFDSGRAQGGDPEAYSSGKAPSGWYTFSPMGMMLGREAHKSSITANPEESVSGSAFAAGVYPGPSYSGGWRTDLETPSQRFDRVANAGDRAQYFQNETYDTGSANWDAWKTSDGFNEAGIDEHTGEFDDYQEYAFTDEYDSGYSGRAGGGAGWNLHNLMKYDRDELAGVVAKEFIPDSAQPDFNVPRAAQQWRGVLTPYSESAKGSQIEEAADSRALAYGTIPTTRTEEGGAWEDYKKIAPESVMKSIIQGAKDYDPIAEGGYEGFEDRLASGMYTSGYTGYESGTLVDNWLEGVKQDWLKYKGNVKDVEGMQDTLRDDKLAFTDPGDVARGELSSLLQEDRERMYGATGVLSGPSLTDTLAKRDIYNTAQTDVFDLQDRYADDLDKYNFASDALQDEADLFAQKWTDLQENFSSAQTNYGSMSNLRRQDWLPSLKQQIMSGFSGMG